MIQHTKVTVIVLLLLIIGCSKGTNPASQTPTPQPIIETSAQDQPAATDEPVAVVEAVTVDPIFNLEAGWTKIEPGGET